MDLFVGDVPVLFWTITVSVFQLLRYVYKYLLLTCPLVLPEGPLLFVNTLPGESTLFSLLL